MNSYTEPKGTNKYTIMEIIDNGQTDFIVDCSYIEKRYIFWGELILKSSPLKKVIRDGKGLQIEVFAKFKSIEDAQIAINKINSNSVRVVKEIEKLGINMWNGRVKTIEKKPYFGFKCPHCSSIFNYYMSGENSSTKVMIDFIESNIKEKKKEGTTIVYSCPKCEKNGSIDFSKEK